MNRIQYQDLPNDRTKERALRFFFEEDTWEAFVEGGRSFVRLPSASRPGETHLATASPWEVSCTCPAHNNGKQCWHVEAAIMMLGPIPKQMHILEYANKYQDYFQPTSGVE